MAVEVLDRGTLSVYDILGRRLREVEISGTKQHLIDLGMFSPGLYVLRFNEVTRAVVIR